MTGTGARSGGALARLAAGRVRAAARVAASVRRRGTPERLLVGLLAVTLLAIGGLAAITLRSSGGPPLARWASGVDGSQPDRSQPEPSQPDPTPPAPFRQPPHPLAERPAVRPPDPPADPTGDFVGWAILDLRTGAITGSGNLAETSTTASMIKAWIVADYLRLTSAGGNQPTPTRLDQLSAIIRDSHNGYTETVFQEIGAHASIERLIQQCGLTDSHAVRYYWSNTRLSPRDTARMGACIADGRAAGPEWTDWLLDEMRAVRGTGDFGIRHAFPDDQRAGVAIKNGWIIRSTEDAWHVNCLAVGDGWAMGVLTRYPAELGLAHGADICRELAAEHLSF